MQGHCCSWLRCWQCFWLALSGAWVYMLVSTRRKAGAGVKDRSCSRSASSPMVALRPPGKPFRASSSWCCCSLRPRARTASSPHRGASLCVVSQRIAIAISSLHDLTVLRTAPIQLADTKRARGTYRHPAYMYASRLEVLRHPCAHQVAGRKAPNALLSRQVPPWEARLVHIGAPVAPASLRGDAQRARDGHVNTSHVSHAQGIKSVSLLDAKPLAVPARPPAAPGSDRQAHHAERLHECKARGVDSSGVPQGQLRLCLHLWVAELGCGPVAFGGIAVMATQHEVADPVGAATTAGQHMIDLKGSLAAPAVHAAPPKFREQVTADFPAAQVATLIDHADEFWVLEQRRIELHAPHPQAADWKPMAIPVCPAEDIADVGAQGRREPTRWSPPVLEARTTMPQVRTPTPSPIASTLAQGVMDLFAAMGQFRQVQAVMHLAPLRVFHPYQGYP